MLESPDRLRRNAAIVAACFVVTLLILGAIFLHYPSPNRMRVGEDEVRASANMDRASTNPLKLRAFLEQMPKGGDLHMHLSGAVYAETFIADAIQDKVCIDPMTAAMSSAGDTCPKGQVPAANALKDQNLYNALVDAFSMRTFVPKSGIDGHDQFFSTFGRFSGRDVKGKPFMNPAHAGEWVDEVATRAASQNEQYLEIMHTPDFGLAATLGYAQGWPGDSREQMAATRDALLAKGLRANVATDRAELDGMDATRNQREHCGTPQAAPACSVTVRYLFQVLRGFPPQQVFAQTLLGFELASVDPRVVGINFVMAEDWTTPMAEYHRQMLMLDYLHSVYPNVHISLHAGELAYGMVPPDGLKFHIREAIELGHAERIGHGIDVMYESDPQGLLKEMAQKHVMVEINLTSNDVILGVTGEHHPLPIYLKARVPVALSTDDEGVSRIDLTHEYQRAVEEFGFNYSDLKRSARTSIEHSFLPGADLWAMPDKFKKFVDVCSDVSSDNCSNFLKGSEKARQEMELEHRFADFEASQVYTTDAAYR